MLDHGANHLHCDAEVEGDEIVAAVVNLDALLPREDLATPVNGEGNIRGIRITELEGGAAFSLLRKPDFQRETASWSPNQIADLIETAVNGDIIPAIILWDSGLYTYVIDGAHRLSALIAWVQDDYGEGTISQARYHNNIPESQRLVARQTKSLVESRVGSYKSIKAAGMYPDNSSKDLVAKANRITFREIDAQWIKNARVEQARAAFFRINQGGSKIENTELLILKSGNAPFAVASRSITRGGSGHAYWSSFTNDEARSEVPKLGADIYKLLFTPPLNLPIRTLDVPLAGAGYGAHVLPFVFDLVTTANSIATRSAGATEPADVEGGATVEMLKRTRKALHLLLSNQPNSLGLHPSLYFYTAGGAFQASALTHAMEWFMDLERDGKTRNFLKIRERFEALLLSHPSVAKPATNKLGSGRRSRPRTKELFSAIMDLLLTGKSADEAWEAITKIDKYKYLVTDDLVDQQLPTLGKEGGRFSKGAKSAAFAAQMLPQAPKCPLCGGFLHTNGMVADHEIPKSEGGSAGSANGRWVHPRCNSEREANENPE